MFALSTFTRMAAVITILLGSTMASAGTFNFSYLADDGSVTGQMIGTLQPDGNTLIVASVSGVKFKGTDPYTLPFVKSFSDYISATGLPAIVTVDGSFMDFCASTNFDCTGVGIFMVNPSIYYPTPFFTGLENDVETFDPRKWSLTAATGTVPEPANLLLMGTALSALAALARRRG
ncbi:MAG: PEP-CTERM sorting domain-containing protein [Acidobacteria bacterium]|nr:PEP-CTERM sorting domain-containing protein [Acidobacteriota bacterium]